MTTQPQILVEVLDGVMLVTLNRSERANAYTYEMQDALHDALDAAAADGAVRAVVLTGSGRTFCPGFDTQALAGAAASGARSQTALRPITYPALVPKPVICAINGGCAGIGLVTAMLCDLRIAADSARFATSFTRLGLPAERTASWVLPRLVGHGAALDLLLTGRTFDAPEALRLGLVNSVAPEGEVRERALALARELATRCSPIAMAAAKRQVYADWARSLERSRDDAARLVEHFVAGSDFRAATEAWGQGRPPAFDDLEASVPWNPHSE